MHHGIGKQCCQRFNIDKIIQYLKSKDAKSWKNHTVEKHFLRYHSSAPLIDPMADLPQESADQPSAG